MSDLFEYYKIYTKEELQQGSDTWKIKRNLKFTASNASIIAASGKGLNTLVNEMLAQHFSSGNFQEYSNNYKNEQMARGNEFESMSRMIYELEMNCITKEVGFIERSKYIGFSPDSIIENQNGAVEFKNHSDKIFLELILNEKINPAYTAQVMYQMWAGEFDFVDLFAFNPNYSPNFFIKRFYPDKEMFAKFENGVKTGIKLIEDSLKILDSKLKVPERNN